MEDLLPSRFQGCDRRHKLQKRHGDSRTHQHPAQACYTWDCTDHTCRDRNFVSKIDGNKTSYLPIKSNKTIGHIIILSGSHPHSSAAIEHLCGSSLFSNNHPHPQVWEVNPIPISSQWPSLIYPPTPSTNLICSVLDYIAINDQSSLNQLL